MKFRRQSVSVSDPCTRGAFRQMILSKDEGEELMARCKPFDGILCKALARLGFIIAEDDESAIRDGDPKIEIC
jgi:hypothetical protein